MCSPVLSPSCCIPVTLVAIRKPKRHVRKISHCGSKQQQRSRAAITLFFLLLLLVCATYMCCCSLRTSRSLWITHSTQRQRRGCNNIPSFLQRTAPIARSFCEGSTWHELPHPGHSTMLLRLESPNGKCAKLRTVAASNNGDHAPPSLLLLVRTTYRWCSSSRTSHSWWIANSTLLWRGDSNTLLFSYLTKYCWALQSFSLKWS